MILTSATVPSTFCDPLGNRHNILKGSGLGQVFPEAAITRLTYFYIRNIPSYRYMVFQARSDFDHVIVCLLPRAQTYMGCWPVCDISVLRAQTALCLGLPPSTQHKPPSSAAKVSLKCHFSMDLRIHEIGKLFQKLSERFSVSGSQRMPPLVIAL